jgi:uncharacterized protein YecE (DUF72 family)
VTTRFPKIGCCGFPLLKPAYAEIFPVVEVQQTFYQPPQKISTLERWRSLVPPDFEFILKAWQIITHTSKSPTYRRLKAKFSPKELEQCGSFKCTPPVLRAWDATLACAKALAARQVLFQCPASFTPMPEHLRQMRKFFSRVDRGGLIFLWEPRGDWPSDLIGSLCEELNLVHVVDPFVSKTGATDLIYFRLHGGKGFKHVFTDAELHGLFNLIPKGKIAYVMFNNIAMLNDARRFQRIVETSYH